MKKLKTYFINVLLGLDQFGNTLWGGDPDETISSRIGRIKTANNGKVPKYRPLVFILDCFLNSIDENHSIDAIEEGKGKDGLFDRPKKKKM